jgi:Scaffold protein Nfu/NifU N terminal
MYLSPTQELYPANPNAFASQIMAEETIKIYHHPNSEIRSFLTQEDLFPPRVTLYKKPLNETTDENFKKMGAFSSQIVREIMSLSGVKEIRVKPKEIRMKKEENTSWDNIEEKVCRILDRALRKKQIKRVK